MQGTFQWIKESTSQYVGDVRIFWLDIIDLYNYTYITIIIIHYHIIIHYL